MRQKIRIGILTLLATTACATQALAQRFDKIVAFGDSYADIGNARAILVSEGLGAFFNNAGLPTGRFSGGTNFVDTISSLYGIPDYNYAVGGALAGSGNVATIFLPGFEQQWTEFTQGGKAFVSGQEITIPQGGYTFRPNDLGVFSVGGNDAISYSEAGTLAGVNAAAATSTAEATQGLDALIARGLKHMVFTVGDVGLVPEFRGTAASQIASGFSLAYNADIQTSLARYAAAGVQVAYVDITQINYSLRPNIARFGFTDVLDACPVTCFNNPQLQSKYFFFVDGLHLTSAGFALVGDYSANQINAPYSFRATGDLPRLAAQDFGQQMAGQLDLERSHPAQNGLSFFGSFTGASSRQEADAASDGYEYGSQGAFAGAEYGLGQITLGALLLCRFARKRHG
jgi:phospholipase/lecithinase/hemolysin